MRTSRSVLPRAAALSSLFLALISCGGNGGGFNALLVQYSGTWEVIYNMTSDDCGLAPEGQTGFVDTHLIAQNGGAVSLQTGTAVTGTLDGETRSDNSFTAQENFTGDVLGDGSTCQLYQAVSYEPTAEDSASSLLIFNIKCAGELVCESRALGESRKQ